MDPLVFGLIGLSSLFHVAWNVLLKHAGDPMRTATVGLGVAAAVLVPAAAIAWWVNGRPAIPPEVVGLAVLSGALEAVYFWLLSNAYRRGDLSVVYPLARGSATLFAVGAGTLILGETLGGLGWLGVGGLVAGLVWLRSPLPLVRAALRRTGPLRRRPGAPSAAGLAVATGLVIAAYSAVDRVGVRLVDGWLYAALLWTAMVGFLLGLVGLASRWRRLTPIVLDRAARPVDRRRAAAGGLLTLAAYAMVLFAFRLAPLTAVAPLRESAVVLASGWGAIRLREAAGQRAVVARIGAAGLILAGATLLALDG